MAKGDEVFLGVKGGGSCLCCEVGLSCSVPACPCRSAWWDMIGGKIKPTPTFSFRRQLVVDGRCILSLALLGDKGV